MTMMLHEMLYDLLLILSCIICRHNADTTSAINLCKHIAIAVALYFIQDTNYNIFMKYHSNTICQQTNKFSILLRGIQ